MPTRHPQLCNRQNGNRFWVEITHCGAFSTSLQKKADSHGKSSFVQNFDAYLESKSKELKAGFRLQLSVAFRANATRCVACLPQPAAFRILLTCGLRSCVMLSVNFLFAAKKPPPPPPEKPLFSFTNEPPPAAVFKFTARVLNAVAPGSPYAQVSVTRPMSSPISCAQH